MTWFWIPPSCAFSAISTQQKERKETSANREFKPWTESKTSKKFNELLHKSSPLTRRKLDRKVQDRCSAANVVQTFPLGYLCLAQLGFDQAKKNQW
jgi:hypothetical protein